MTEVPSLPSEQSAAAYGHLARLIGGYQVSAAIGALARLGVADALGAGPATSTELAESLGADEDALTRLMNATLDNGLFALGDDGRYCLTALGGLLRADATGSLRRYAVASTDHWRWNAYGHLAHTLRTGEPGFVAAHGCRLWDYLASHPDAAASFEESLTRVAAFRDQAVVASVDLSGSRCLVDVGGGRGDLLFALLAANPDLHGVLFDLPGVIEDARGRLPQRGVEGRCEAIAGDFRNEVPSGGDAYLLSWILHDWDDLTARRILVRCREAMDAGARLLVVEMVVPEGDGPGASAFKRLVRQADLEMLAVVGGRERSAAEFERLLEQSGFALARVVPLEDSPWSIIEGAAV